MSAAAARRRPVRLAAVAVAAAASALALAPAAPAAAGWIVDEGNPGMLTLEIEPGALAAELSPGDTTWWAVSAMLDTDGGGPLGLVVEVDGALASAADGLQLGILECSAPWQLPVDPFDAAVCPASSSTVLSTRPASSITSGHRLAIGRIDPGADRHFVITVGLPSSASEAMQGAEATLAFGFEVQGDAETVVPGGGLPGTGSSAAPPAVLAAALVAGGVLLAVRRRIGARR